MGATYFVEPLVNEARIANAQNQWQPLSPCDNCINTFYLNIRKLIDAQGIYCLKDAIHTSGTDLFGKKRDIYSFHKMVNNGAHTIYQAIECKEGDIEKNGSYEHVVHIYKVVCEVDGELCFREPLLVVAGVSKEQGHTLSRKLATIPNYIWWIIVLLFVSVWLISAMFI